MKDMLQRSLRSGVLLSLAAFGVACGSGNLYQLKNQGAANADDASLNLTAGKAISELKEEFKIQLVEQYALKNDMSQQFSLLSHCKEMEGDKMVCALTDSDAEGAKLIGVETIISEADFNNLSEEEKASYHSHKNEVESGRMMVNGMEEAEAKSLMDKLSSTFGKAELFMMPGTDTLLESTMILTTIEGGGLGVMGDKGKMGDDTTKSDDQGGDFSSDGKSADQSLTPAQNPMQSQGAMGEEPIGEEPKSDEPVQKDEPQEPMKASQFPIQGELPTEEPKGEEPKAEEPSKDMPVQSTHMGMPAQSQGSFSAAPAQHQGSLSAAPAQYQGSLSAAPAQSQGTLTATPAEDPKSPAELPKGSDEPTQSQHKFAGQHAAQR